MLSGREASIPVWPSGPVPYTLINTVPTCVPTHTQPSAAWARPRGCPTSLLALLTEVISQLPLCDSQRTSSRQQTLSPFINQIFLKVLVSVLSFFVLLEGFQINYLLYFLIFRICPIFVFERIIKICTGYSFLKRLTRMLKLGQLCLDKDHLTNSWKMLGWSL